jgi:hypothetical protein
MWPFSWKAKSKAAVFKDTQAFFDHWCKFGQTVIRPRTPLLAIVLDARKQYGTREPVERRPDGIQKAALKVASWDGGFSTLPSLTPTAKGDRLQPNDLVLWKPIVWDKALAIEFGDPRKGWIGLIVAKVDPVLGASGSFIVAARFD